MNCTIPASFENPQKIVCSIIPEKFLNSIILSLSNNMRIYLLQPHIIITLCRFFRQINNQFLQCISLFVFPASRGGRIVNLK